MRALRGRNYQNRCRVNPTNSDDFKRVNPGSQEKISEFKGELSGKTSGEIIAFAGRLVKEKNEQLARQESLLRSPALRWTIGESR